MKQLSTLILCLVLLFSTQDIRAQKLKLNHIAVYVENLKTSTAFYKDVLQLMTTPEPFHDGLHTWFTLGGAGKLHLIQGAKSGVTRDKNDHLCFSVSDIHAFIANLKQHRVTYYDWPKKGTSNNAGGRCSSNLLSRSRRTLD